MNEGKGRGKKHLSFGVHRVIRTYTPEHRIQKTQTYTTVSLKIYKLPLLHNLYPGANTFLCSNIGLFTLEFISFLFVQPFLVMTKTQYNDIHKTSQEYLMLQRLYENANECSYFEINTLG